MLSYQKDKSYFLHYKGIRRCGFLWLRKRPIWEVRQWHSDSECWSRYTYVVVARLTDHQAAKAQLELFKGNQL